MKNNSNRKILITGATGYIGSRVHSSLATDFDVYGLSSKTENLGKKIFSTDGRLDSLIGFLKKNGPFDVVVHLAAKAKAHLENSEFDEFVRSNFTFGLNLLEAMNQTGHTKFLNTGTYWQEFSLQSPHANCLYSALKTAFEDVLKYHVAIKNFNVLTLRLFDVYGPNDNRGKILQRVRAAAQSRLELEMTGGQQAVYFTHIDDIAMGYQTALNSLLAKTSPAYEKFDLRSERRILREVVELYCELNRIQPNLSWGKKPYGAEQIMEPVTFERLPNWTAQTTLQQGLEGI